MTTELLDITEFPEIETPGIADNQTAKHPGLDELFKKALLGELPRSRSLKPWEPDRLNETHLQIILLRAGGMRQRDIALFLNDTQGLKLTDATVSITCNHPDAVLILSTLVSYAADNITDLVTRMKAYAAEGLQRNVQIMRQTKDEKLASRIGFSFLDRAGYSSVQKVTGTIEHEHRVVMEPAAANNLASALREVQAPKAIGPGSPFIQTGEQMLFGEGSGNSLDTSESQEDSGPLVARKQPPPRTSLIPKAVVVPHPDEDDTKDFQAVRAAKPLQKIA